MRNVFWRQIRLLLVVFIGYLFHVTVMTQLDTTVSINLPLVILSVVIVGYPRYKAFWVGAVYGILLAALFLGEIPSLREVLGGAVVFACAIWDSLKKEA